MRKVRVYELAKDYGMKAPDLAALLRQSGMEKVKGHMTALDDADLMMAEGLLAAQGHSKSGGGSGGKPSGGLKKKKLPADDAPAADTPPAEGRHGGQEVVALGRCQGTAP